MTGRRLPVQHSCAKQREQFCRTSCFDNACPEKEVSEGPAALRSARRFIVELSLNQQALEYLSLGYLTV